MAVRKYILGTAKQLAKALGVSESTARRRLRGRPGAVKVKGRWSVPLTASEYSAAEGVSIKRARARGVALSNQDLEKRPGTVREILRTVIETDLEGDGPIPDSHYLPAVGMTHRYAYSWRAVIKLLDTGEVKVVQGSKLMSNNKASKETLRRETVKELRAILGPGRKYHGHPYTIVSITVVSWKNKKV